MSQIISYTQSVNWLFNEVHLLTEDYVKEAYLALNHFLAKPLLLAMTLYIVILGLCMTQGWVQMSFSNLVKITLKLAFIYSFAMNWDIFCNYAVNLIVDGSSELGNALMKAAILVKPNMGNATIQNALQDILNSVTLIGQKIFAEGSFRNLSPYFCGLLVWGFGYLLIIVAMMELLCAQVLLALMLGMAPLFICFTLFKSLHSLFDRWLGHITAYALTQILVSATLGFVLVIAEKLIPINALLNDLNLDSLNLVTFVPLMLLSLLSVGILLKSAGIAMSIGSAITTISGSQLFAGFANKALDIGGLGAGLGSKTLSGMNNIIGASQKTGETIGKGIGNSIGAIKDKLRKG